MSVARIRKNDVVVAIKGVSAGKTGKVLQVLPREGRALVEGLNLVKKTIRKTPDTPQGGIIEKESPIALSNLMPYCPECKRGTRIARVKDGERRIRKCRRCGHVFDV
ncbi:MAG: 50S ribosomal protein L24 [Kiritimatiellae bacterium]|nr:50S ribosomal protein L24 [Kiritimatiellia bacterium]